MLYHNGQFISHAQIEISATERGFLLGDGLFETIRCYQGRPLAFATHYQRLCKSAEFLQIPFTLTQAACLQVIQTLLQKNDLFAQDAVVRITLTRGEGPRGLVITENTTPTCLITASAYQQRYQKNYTVSISDIRRNEFSPLAQIKSLNYLDNILARRQANKKGFDDAFLLNTNGNLACASSANIFLVTANGIATPSLASGVLPGIVRSVVMQLCAEQHWPYEEKIITTPEIFSAQEIFITNSLLVVQPVTTVEDQVINSGEMGSMTQKILRNVQMQLGSVA